MSTLSSHELDELESTARSITTAFLTYVNTWLSTHNVEAKGQRLRFEIIQGIVRSISFLNLVKTAEQYALVHNDSLHFRRDAVFVLHAIYYAATQIAKQVKSPEHLGAFDRDTSPLISSIPGLGSVVGSSAGSLAIIEAITTVWSTFVTAHLTTKDTVTSPLDRVAFLLNNCATTGVHYETAEEMQAAIDTGFAHDLPKAPSAETATLALTVKRDKAVVLPSREQAIMQRLKKVHQLNTRIKTAEGALLRLAANKDRHHEKYLKALDTLKNLKKQLKSATQALELAKTSTVFKSAAGPGAMGFRRHRTTVVPTSSAS